MTIMRKVVSVLWIACLAVAADAADVNGEENWYHWRRVGPSELVTLSTKTKTWEPGSVRVVTVRNRGWHEAVWVGAGFSVDESRREGGFLVMDMRSDRPHTQLVKIVDSRGNAGIWNLYVGTQWQTVWLNIDSPHERQGRGGIKDIAWVEFSSFVRPPHDDAVYETEVRKIRTMKMEAEPVSDRHWMPAKRAPGVEGYRAEVSVHNVGNGTDYPGLNSDEGFAMLMEIAKHLYGFYGSSLGISTAYPESARARKFAEWMTARNCNVGSEGHISGGLDNLERLGALQLNREGRSYKSFMPNIDGSHGEDMTNPDFIRWARGMVNNAADAGARDWRTIDYIWPCHGGYAWGYSDSSRVFWRDALAGRDIGIESTRGGRIRKVYFPEYFKIYTGLDLSPAFIGAESWDGYEPPADGERNANRWRLHDLLAHYAWILGMNELGREAFEKTGMQMKPVLNPEHIETGTDIWGLSLGRFIGGACVEWWHAADCIVSTYYAGPYYSNAYRKNNLELILTEESAAAGGNPYQGRPFYWDNYATYMICYAKGASVDATAVFNQYWQSSLGKMLNPELPDYDCYASFICSFDGFLQAKADGAKRLDSDVLVIANRAIADRSASFDRSVEGQSTAMRHLMRLNYNHYGAGFPLADSFDPDRFSVIFFNPTHAPAGFSSVLRKWLDDKPGRTLVAYGSNAAAFFGDGRERIPGIGPGLKKSGPVQGFFASPDPAFAKAMGDRIGSRAGFPGGLWSDGGKASKILLSVDGVPVVEERLCGKGRLLFVAADIGSSEDASDDAAIVDALMRYMKRRPMGISSGGNFAALPFTAGKSLTYVLQNRSASYDVADESGRVWWSFQAKSAKVSGSVRCYTGKPGARMKLTDRVFGDTWFAAADAEGYVMVPMDGFNMRLITFDTE